MHRDRFSANVSSDDGESTERTGLVRHSSFPGAYPYFGSSSDRVDAQRNRDSSGAFIREENMTAYYRQTFTTTGVNIGLRDVTQVVRHRLHRYFPRLLPSSVVCESVSAFLATGQLHAVVDADGAAAKALLKVISGDVPCDSGEIAVGSGGLTTGFRFRRTAGMVSRTSAAVPNLSVQRNLQFVLDMRTRGNGGWKRQMIQSVTAFVSLGPLRKVGDLSPVEQFALRIAMELVLDPPVIVAIAPFEGLDYTARSRAAALLKSVANVLSKTVVVSARSLAAHLFHVCDTTLLLGGGGRVLFSGPTSHLIKYFNDLHIPRDHDAAEAVGGSRVSLAGWQDESGATDALRSTPTCSLDDAALGSDREQGTSHRLHQTLLASSTTPPRISSRLFADAAGTPLADLMSRAGRLGSPGSVVFVCSGDDVLDLAVEWSESDAQTMYYAAKFYDSDARERLMEDVNALFAGAGGADTYGVPLVAEPQRALWKPVLLLSHFFHQSIADMELVLGTVGLLVVMLTVSLLMHFQAEDQGAMYNIRGILFLLFVLVLVTNEATMGSIAGQLRLFLHQRNSGLYGTLCFVFCLTIRVMSVRALYLVLLVPFVLSVVQASKGVVALVGLISVVHALLLYAFYALVPSRRFAAWCAHAYFVFSIMCSGFLLNLRSLPAAFGATSVMRWGYGPALRERLHGKEFSCDGAGNTSYCYTGEEYLAIEGFTNDSFGRSFLALAITGVASLLVLAAALTYQ